jgi:hypothetical protein
MFFKRPALESFVGVFKVVTIRVIVLELADNLSGMYFVHDITARTFHGDFMTTQYC